FGFAENTDDLFVGKTLLHGDVLMWLMKTLLTSGCTNQRGAGHTSFNIRRNYFIVTINISLCIYILKIVAFTIFFDEPFTAISVFLCR
ncbi:hypothetical protein CA254_18170, partial [Enterobacter hormaechei]